MKAKKIVPGRNIAPYWECANCWEIVRDYRVELLTKVKGGYKFCPWCGEKQEYEEDK